MELTIEQALNKAVEEHKAGNLEIAASLYSSILNVQPKHPDANHNIGVLAVGLGKVQNALPYFKNAIEANPDIAQFWISYIDAVLNLGQLADAGHLLDQAKSKAFMASGLDRLEKRLNEANKELFNINAAEQIKTNQANIVQTAARLRDVGELSQAIDLLKDELIRTFDDVDIIALLSHCYLLDDQIEEARHQLDKVQKLVSENALVGWNTARLKLKENKTSDALNIARSCSAKFPDDVEGMGVLGACLRVSGEIVESLGILNNAIERDPDYAEALIQRGLIRLSQKNSLDALADLEQAHKIKPHLKQIWDLVIGLKLEKHEYSELIPYLLRMIEIDPNNEKRFATLAFCYQNLKDLNSAIHAYRKALVIKPDYAEAYNNMGNAFQEQGRLEAAVEAYQNALAIKPDYTEAHYNMGNALKAQDELEDAVAAFNSALTINPDFSDASAAIGDCLLRMGKFEEGRSLIQKSEGSISL